MGQRFLCLALIYVLIGFYAALVYFDRTLAPLGALFGAAVVGLSIYLITEAE